MVIGSVLVILVGLAVMVWGGTKGVTVTAPDPDGRQRSTKVYGTGALIIGAIVIAFGVAGLLRGLEVF